ncbi:acid phosphatase [Nocardioides panacihumi]|uniref:Acid phosphatase n=2 Tax=Nocardioides panacihumi TaxID=400774 RepID=A0ABN2RPD9_9ACTN
MPAALPNWAAMTDLYLVRHGATEWSIAGRHTGTTDLPLLPEGEDTARALTERLRDADFGLVLTSPRQRARRTAELAGFPDAVVDDDLAEWDYGDYEGVTTEAIREKDPGWTIWSGVTPGGETPEQVGDRLDRVIERVRATHGDALVFGHGHALRALAARWLGLPVAEGRLLKLDTATLSVLGFEREQPVVLRWNS